MQGVDDRNYSFGHINEGDEDGQFHDESGPGDKRPTLHEEVIPTLFSNLHLALLHPKLIDYEYGFDVFFYFRVFNCQHACLELLDGQVELISHLLPLQIMDLCIQATFIEFTETVFGKVIRIQDLPLYLLEEILFCLEIMCFSVETIDQSDTCPHFQLLFLPFNLLYQHAIEPVL